MGLVSAYRLMSLIGRSSSARARGGGGGLMSRVLVSQLIIDRPRCDGCIDRCDGTGSCSSLSLSNGLLVDDSSVTRPALHGDVN